VDDCIQYCNCLVDFKMNINSKILDIYTDYLICQNKYATATGLSDLLDGDMSHDKVTRFLSSNDFNSKHLWQQIKHDVRKYQSKSGVIILDDTIEEKPYTDENDVNCYHYSHLKGSVIKGINILSCIVKYGDINLPIGYEVIKKPTLFCDTETKKVKRKSETNKNRLFKSLISQACHNQVLFSHILADNWFGSKDNMEYINNDIKKLFIIGIKSNRNISLSQHGPYQTLKSQTLEEDTLHKIWLKGILFPVMLMKKVFTNEDGSKGILYIASNDYISTADQLYSIYQKRWSIEEYHKSIKQNASLAKSPTKKVKSQCNHIFLSIISFCKLELLKVQHHLNHFAIKYKLIVKANQIAMKELQLMKCQFA
jgi:hypothetical protein